MKCQTVVFDKCIFNTYEMSCIKDLLNFLILVYLSMFFYRNSYLAYQDSGHLVGTLH